MNNLKAHQKSNVICEFGVLIQPIEELARAKQPPSLDKYRIAIAKVQAGDPAWRRQVKDFTTFEHDVVFSHEEQDISHVAENCCCSLRDNIDRAKEKRDVQIDLLKVQEKARDIVSYARQQLIEHMDVIPIAWEPDSFDANTPFTAYLRIKETIVSVKNRLHYFDRYLAADFLTMFLDSVNSAVSIRLVTTAIGVANVSGLSNLARGCPESLCGL